MAIKVHGSPMSTATMSVAACLIEKELDFEFVPVDMASGEHKKHPYLSLNVSIITLSLLLVIIYIYIFMFRKKKAIEYI
uniref:glutathione transferase n=1 Tax=Nicotiana tabacum TaxID=4097 RepID=Q40533_TOBAC|nr:parB product which have an activity of glutathione S-transferase [Nicotiana tabacum]